MVQITKYLEIIKDHSTKPGYGTEFHIITSDGTGSIPLKVKIANLQNTQTLLMSEKFIKQNFLNSNFKLFYMKIA